MSASSPCPISSERSVVLEDLRRMQVELRELAARLAVEDLTRSYHAALSPIGWHLGHCAFVESYWVREVVLGEPLPPELHHRYFPELNEKSSRGKRLPQREELLAFVGGEHRRNLTLLAEPPPEADGHALMEDDYLLRFLHQHYAQHVETVRYVLTQLHRGAARPDSGSRAVPEEGVRPVSPKPPAALVPQGGYRIGSDEGAVFDNERREHTAELEAFLIAQRPVTIEEWRAFQAAGGYSERRYWSQNGWIWRCAHAVDRPDTWLDIEGRRVARPDGVREPSRDEPVDGLSHHEAVAFAAWAGARLPHEQEWEAARRSGYLSRSGEVWEWTASALDAYPGFQPYPYDGYTVPWLDGNHYVLRGGSRWSEPAVRRATFRNFYEPDQRHQHAGVRLVFDEPALSGQVPAFNSLRQGVRPTR